MRIRFAALLPTASGLVALVFVVPTKATRASLGQAGSALIVLRAG
jgi:hypothetical protein